MIFHLSTVARGNVEEREGLFMGTMMGSNRPKGLTDAVLRRYLGLSLHTVGATCSCCGTSKSEEVKLRKCKKCLRKAYCGKPCQLQDWKEGGHKTVCRPPKDFKAQDIVRVVNVQRDDFAHAARMNGQLMEVDGPAHEEKRWMVIIIGAGAEERLQRLSFHEDELRLAVPVEERVDLDP